MTISGLPPIYDKLYPQSNVSNNPVSISLAQSPYTVPSNISEVNVDTAGGNVTVIVPVVARQIKINKTSSDSYVVLTTSTENGEVAGYRSGITYESGYITKDEPWYPYDMMVQILNDEVVAKNKFGKCLSSSWRGAAGTDDSSVMNAIIPSAVMGLKIVLGNGVYYFNSPISISKEYITIEAINTYVHDLAFYRDHLPVTIKSTGNNNIFDVSRTGFNCHGLIFDHTYKSIVFSPNATAGQLRASAINDCGFFHNFDTPITYDATTGYIVGFNEIKRNKFVTDNTIASFIKFICPSATYETTAVIIDENDLSCNNVTNVIDVDVDSGGYIEFNSFRKNYVEGASNTFLNIDIQSGGVVNFYSGITDNKINGSGVLISAIVHCNSGNSALSFNGFTNNNFEGGTCLFKTTGYAAGTHLLTGMRFVGNYINSAIRFWQDTAYFQSALSDIEISNNYLVSNITLTKPRSANISNNTHYSIVISTEDTQHLRILNNLPLDTNRTLGITIVNPTELHYRNTKISGNPKYLTENSGSSKGTGSKQTIAHGLAAIPTGCKAWIRYPISATVYAEKEIRMDTTNIYPKVKTGLVYDWRVE